MCTDVVVAVLVAVSSAPLVAVVSVVQILLVAVPNALIPTPCQFPLGQTHPPAVVAVVAVALEKIWLESMEELENLEQKIVACVLAWKLSVSVSRCYRPKVRVSLALRSRQRRQRRGPVSSFVRLDCSWCCRSRVLYSD